MAEFIASRKMTEREQTAYELGKHEAMSRIVRCKDCIYNMPDISGEKYVVCERHDFTEFPRDGFCSYGERREANVQGKG